MDVSVIIPTLNEERALPATLNSLLLQSGEFETIVVDAASTDATCTVAKGYRDRLANLSVFTAPRGRASQMNAGAGTAYGKWLLFLHADTRLQPGAIAAVAALSQHTDTEAGCFTHRFSGSGFVLRLISHMHNYRFRRTLIMYGDQAIFVKRSLFFRIGGFPDALMEDVLFSEKLRAIARPIMLHETAVTDSRKFEQLGPVRALLWVVRILLAHRHERPLPHREFFNEYR